MIPREICFTGTIYIKYIDVLDSCKIGDILLLLHDDTTSSSKGDYENANSSGYIKAQLFDGKVWQHIDITEFCHAKENKFLKRQRAIDSALLCKDILLTYKGVVVYKTYRGHFTAQKYEKTPYNRKSSYGRK